MGKGGPKFKELRVWQKSKELAVYIYCICLAPFYNHEITQIFTRKRILLI